jgi:hypothetical protein
VPKPETLQEVDEYLKKARSTTVYDIANRFNIRMSIARSLLAEREAKGSLVAYVRDGGFVAYSSPAEVEKRQTGRPVLIADALEEVASSVTHERLMTDEIETALAAAASIAALKPGRIARQRREFGERKEKTRDRRPEVVVEPLEGEEGPERSLEPAKSISRPTAPREPPRKVEPKPPAVSAEVSEAESRPKRAPSKPEKPSRPAAKVGQKAKPKKKPETAARKPAKPAKPAQKAQASKKPASQKAAKTAKKK